MRYTTRQRISSLGALLLSASIATSSVYAAEITGRISGVVTSDRNLPLAGVTVTAHSPSQTLTTTSDSAGHYVFVALTPDSYTVTAHRTGYRDQSLTGVGVQADTVRDETIVLSSDLKEIARTTARSRSGLVQPGVTGDLYSVSGAQLNAGSSLGGGPNRDSVLAPLASVPGVFVPIGQSGFGQSVFIRGGGYDQTGYEFDGVPLNRTFDQYAQSPLSSLGTEELQVYTGSAPIDQQASGLGGYVNQVVKSGSYPRTASLDLGVGTPAFSNSAKLELSGAESDAKKFTYYLGLSGYDFTQRLVDQYNGASLAPTYGPVVAVAPGACGPNNAGPCYPNGPASNLIGGLPLQPNGYQTAPTFFGQVPAATDREAIANLHFAIPHHRDATRDDVQLLYANSYYLYRPNATLAELGAASSTLPVSPYYIDQNAYTGPLGAELSGTDIGRIANLGYPGQGSAGLDAPLPPTQGDTRTNTMSIAKIGYRHNIGTTATARVSLYQVSSKQIENGLVGVFQPYFGDGIASVYNVATNTIGIDTSFTDQITPKHLASVDLGRSSSLTRRLYDYAAALAPASPVAVLVNAANPSGGCYGVDASNLTAIADCATGAATYVLPPVGPPGTGYALQPSTGSPDIATAGSLTCGSGPCGYLTVSNGANGDLSQVRTQFSNFSLSDHWRITPRLTVDLGLRYDDFAYLMANTDTPANRLFVTTFNQLNCVNGTSIQTKASASDSCASFGPGYAPAALSAASHNLDYQLLSPRIGATLTTDPRNVVRIAYGRYVQPAPAGAVQSVSLQPFYPDPSYYAQFGFASPTRDLRPETSNNLDLSWEHQFADNRTSFKFTPFYRTTQAEIVAIPVDPKSNFIAYVNGLNRQAAGAELAVRSGDFKKNGFSSMLSYTYTHTVAHYPTSATGGSFVGAANQAIKTYNGYTSFCAQNPGDSRCPSSASVAGPCYTPANAANGALSTAGVAGACGPGLIANPYWNAQPAALLDPNAGYAPYNGVLGPGSYGTSTSYAMPHVAALVMNYRHNRFAVTPTFQYLAGARYGTPFAAQGVAPGTCTSGLNGSAAGDPRYAGGASAGSPYDASSCYGTVTIPDPATGHFDGIGEFRQPSLFTMNLRMSYDASPNATIELTGVNIFHRCFGGSAVPWSMGGDGCSYIQATPYVGNFYNPGDPIQRLAEFPYVPYIGSVTQATTAGATLPVQIYADVKFRL